MKLTLVNDYRKIDYIEIEMNEAWLEEFKDYCYHIVDDDKEVDNITLEAIEDYYNDNEKQLVFHVHDIYSDRVWEFVIDDLIADWKNEFGYEYPVTRSEVDYCDYDSDWEVTF